jgi:hypothetical protein
LCCHFTRGEHDLLLHSSTEHQHYIKNEYFP